VSGVFQLTRGIVNDRVISMKRWLVLSLLTPKDLIEPISNFLTEQGAAGIEEVEESLEQERLKAYFLQNGSAQKILCSLRQYLKSMHEMNPKIPLIEIETSSIPDQDWGENWKRFFKPIRVGSRFIIKPPWTKIRLKRDEIPLEFNPGMAFGTGTHATTQLCIALLEKGLKRRGLSVLDIGTGSGILAIAAAKLGASEVWGIDIDRTAVEIAKENVRLNSVSDKVKILRSRIGAIRKTFNLIVANIDYKSLRRARTSMLHHLKKSGFLILSGILLQEEERLRQHYIRTGKLRWTETRRDKEWVCLVFKKR